MRLGDYKLWETGRRPLWVLVPGLSDKEQSSVTTGAGHKGECRDGRQELGRMLHVVLTCWIWGAWGKSRWRYCFWSSGVESGVGDTVWKPKPIRRGSKVKNGDDHAKHIERRDSWSTRKPMLKSWAKIEKPTKESVAISFCCMNKPLQNAVS